MIQNTVMLALLIITPEMLLFRMNFSTSNMSCGKKKTPLKNAHPFLHSLYPKIVEFPQGLLFLFPLKLCSFLYCIHISRHSITLFMLTGMLKILLLSNWMLLHIGTPFFSDESDRRKIATSIALWFFFFSLTAAVKGDNDRHNGRKSQKRLEKRRTGYKGL